MYWRNVRAAKDDLRARAITVLGCVYVCRRNGTHPEARGVASSAHPPLACHF